jgi:formylglycine-generating enzyme required for sulfatase activity
VDLVGNVAEWVSDPAGLVCGGGFDTSRLEEMGRPGTRAVFPDAVSPSIGFRCCRDPI